MIALFLLFVSRDTQNEIDGDRTVSFKNLIA
jgi:hypothetical protein